MSKRPAWSFSALEKYETCPYQYYRVKVAKDVKDSMGEAALWGNDLHNAMDKCISEDQPMPNRFKRYEKYARMVRNAPGEVLAEQKLCLNQDYKPTKFFAKDAWCRGIIDATVLNGNKAWMLDWKTGKQKDSFDQLMLFAGMAFRQWPHLESARCSYVWFKTGALTSRTFTKDEEPEIWQHFETKLTRLEKSYSMNRWPKKPSGLCRGWCPVTDCPNYEPR